MASAHGRLLFLTGVFLVALAPLLWVASANGYSFGFYPVYQNPLNPTSTVTGFQTVTQLQTVVQVISGQTTVVSATTVTNQQAATTQYITRYVTVQSSTYQTIYQTILGTVYVYGTVYVPVTTTATAATSIFSSSTTALTTSSSSTTTSQGTYVCNWTSWPFATMNGDLQVNVCPGGSVTGSISGPTTGSFGCGGGQCSSPTYYGVKSGSVITLTESPSPGYVAGGWLIYNNGAQVISDGIITLSSFGQLVLTMPTPTTPITVIAIFAYPTLAILSYGFVTLPNPYAIANAMLGLGVISVPVAYSYQGPDLVMSWWLTLIIGFGIVLMYVYRPITVSKR